MIHSDVDDDPMFLVTPAFMMRRSEELAPKITFRDIMDIRAEKIAARPGGTARHRPDGLCPYKSGTIAAFISLISHLPFTRTNVSSELVCTTILFASLSTHRHSK